MVHTIPAVTMDESVIVNRPGVQQEYEITFPTIDFLALSLLTISSRGTNTSL